LHWLWRPVPAHLRLSSFRFNFSQQKSSHFLKYHST